MKRTRLAALSLVAALLIAGGAFHAGRTLGPAPDEHAAHAPAPAASTPEPAAEKKILYWHDPMVPGARFDKPGKSPFMDMQLVPMYADADSVSGTRIDPTIQQNLGIRHATVRRIESNTSVEAIGSVQFDERLGVAVQTRVAGYVEHLAVRAPMESVRKGQALATVFAPEWLAPQNELLALQRSGVSQEIISAARDRMRAMSIPAELIRQSEKAGSAQARFTLTAPANGVVTELGVREGMAVTPGMTMFRIGGLDKVWAVVEVPEAQASRIRVGQKVKAVLQADATQSFDGKLTEILPQIDAATRTLKARFAVDNAQRKLVPGMLLRLQVEGPKTTRLVVTSEAVIRTGKRAVVIVRKANGAFEPRDVTLGADLGDDIEIIDGLTEGEQVVASGQFLIDSEARLRSVLGNMAPQKP
ncbi:efflux RND transporter periplasmic adaptor subunit [Variovorax rhizosphaerae]|uniref:Efflux RND transporter periplasmic adaptor subunit n=1 Tax=Variovorax rhizosphaerae TaxID=1836200 RepID=A0ABU8WD95_9BURK